MPTSKGSKKTRELKEKLVNEQTRSWDHLGETEKKQVFSYAQGYRDFLNRARTERSAVQSFVEFASKKGFKDFNAGGKNVKRVFHALRGKILAMAVLGKKPMSDGIRIITSHVDCPRLDLKPNPLYEDTGLALLKTHYYGGIKKYHWVARSLAICGTVIRGDGSTVQVEIGLNPEDPVFTIPDLLPHLAKKQMEQKASEFMPGENLNLIVGACPLRGSGGRGACQAGSPRSAGPEIQHYGRGFHQRRASGNTGRAGSRLRIRQEPCGRVRSR